MDTETLDTLKEIKRLLEDSNRELKEVLDFVHDLQTTVAAMSGNPMLKAMGFGATGPTEVGNGEAPTAGAPVSLPGMRKG